MQYWISRSSCGSCPATSWSGGFSTSMSGSTPWFSIAHRPWVSHMPKRSEEHTSELQSQSNLACRLLLAKHDKIASDRQIARNGHIKYNLTISLPQLNVLETLVIIIIANNDAFLQVTRRRFMHAWDAFRQ